VPVGDAAHNRHAQPIADVAGVTAHMALQDLQALCRIQARTVVAYARAGGWRSTVSTTSPLE
jgi:hypothetical protein